MATKKKWLVIFGWGLVLPLLFGLYIATVLVYGTLNDFQPPLHNTIQGDGPKAKTENLPDTLDFLTWNLGYAGLGKEMDFFYDGGKKVRPEKALHEKYMKGISDFLRAQNDCDFFLLQEVDSASRRSYFTNEYHRLLQDLKTKKGFFALNYAAPFVPMPITEPMGKACGGLATFSAWACDTASRFDYPGDFPWPKRVFILDRCMMVNRFSLRNNKELVVLNTHNSAYDDDGKMKKGEMKFIKAFLEEEYAKENFVIAGGDWNQSPPEFSFVGKKEAMQVPPDFTPENWKWVFDATQPTNRILNAPYNPDTSSTSLIDFFLVSPNVEIIAVKTFGLGFSDSDHNPVRTTLRLMIPDSTITFHE